MRLGPYFRCCRAPRTEPVPAAGRRHGEQEGSAAAHGSRAEGGGSLCGAQNGGARQAGQMKLSPCAVVNPSSMMGPVVAAVCQRH